MESPVPLSPQRKFVSPAPGETLEDIAQRNLADRPAAEGVDALRSWNLHIFALRSPPGLLLCSDVIFVEPPRAA